MTNLAIPTSWRRNAVNIDMVWIMTSPHPRYIELWSMLFFVVMSLVTVVYWCLKVGWVNSL